MPTKRPWLDELNGLAQLHAAKGEFARAKEVYADSLQNFKAIEEREGVGNVTSNNGFVILHQGDLKGAQRAFEEALVLFQEVGMRTHEVASWGDLAIAHRRQGRFAEALELSDRSLKALRDIGDTEKEMMYLRGACRTAERAGPTGRHAAHGRAGDEAGGRAARHADAGADSPAVCRVGA